MFYLHIFIYLKIILKKHRCSFQVNKEEKKCVKMCNQCSFKKRYPEQHYTNEMSCLVCGGWVFTQSPQMAFKCTRHSTLDNSHMYKCYICNAGYPIPQGPNSHLLFKKAKLCHICAQRDSCCMFNFSK